MPISQLTVLALYGELRNAVLAIETATSEIYELRTVMTYGERIARTEALCVKLRAAGIGAERAAIELILQDAPAININPLTGEAS